MSEFHCWCCCRCYCGAGEKQGGSRPRKFGCRRIWLVVGMGVVGTVGEQVFLSLMDDNIIFV